MWRQYGTSAPSIIWNIHIIRSTCYIQLQRTFNIPDTSEAQLVYYNGGLLYQIVELYRLCGHPDIIRLIKISTFKCNLHLERMEETQAKSLP